MPAVSTREQLIDYCLRQLGEPVIEINVDPDQVEDRIDDALQFYREYHFDAVEEVYLKARAMPSNVYIANAAPLIIGETITGLTSGETAIVLEKPIDPPSHVHVYQVTGNGFQTGEFIRGDKSNVSLNVQNFQMGTYDKQYFDIPDAVTGVKKVLPFFDRASGINLFDIRYQMLVNDLYNLMSVDMIHYSMIQTHLTMINELLVGQKPFRFNRHTNRLYIEMDWKRDVQPYDYLIVNCYRILDPSTYTDVYNDMFLKRYATALIKKQWGTNMKKFQGVQLPGGVVLNGQQIYDEAIEEITKIEEEMQSRFELPVDFITG